MVIVDCVFLPVEAAGVDLSLYKTTEEIRLSQVWQIGSIRTCGNIVTSQDYIAAITFILKGKVY